MLHSSFLNLFSLSASLPFFSVVLYFQNFRAKSCSSCLNISPLPDCLPVSPLPFPPSWKLLFSGIASDVCNCIIRVGIKLLHLTIPYFSVHTHTRMHTHTHTHTRTHTHICKHSFSLPLLLHTHTHTHTHTH